MVPGLRVVHAFVVLLVAALGAASTAAAPTTGTCSPTRVKYLASDQTLFRTESTTYVKLPQGSVTFTQGGTTASCVIVTLSAQPNAVSIDGQEPAPMRVRVLLDNIPGLPSFVAFSDGSDAANQVRSFDFIFPGVAPGKHTVRLQFKAALNASFTDMNRHNLIVHFAP